METSPNPTPQPAGEDGPSIDPVEIARFVVAAARRNLFTCILVGLLTLGAGLAAVSAIPRKYESTSKVFVSNTGVVTAQLTSGRRGSGDEGSLKDLRESVFNRANLLALVRDAHLVENWPKTRNWLQRIVDRARVAVRGPTSKRDMEDLLVDTLAPMIDVKPEDSSSIRFTAAWRDPKSAQTLTMLLQQNYIAAKEVEELAAITRATSVLEDEVKRSEDAFEPAVRALLEETAKARDRIKAKTGPANRPAATDLVATIVGRPAAPPAELTAKLAELRDEERSLVEPWQRRSAELKLQLADLRAVYGPQHPSVVALESKVKSAAAEPVELLDVRQRQAELKSSIANLAVSSSARPVIASGPRGPAEADPSKDIVINLSDDPALAPARLQLETALRKSAEMQARLDAARMELAIAQVSFKYRYRQVEPAKFWPKPIKPKVPALIAGAVVAALVVGFLAGAGREVLNGKIMETWQINQAGLEVIATVDVRAWSLPQPTRRNLPPSTTRRS